MNSHDDLHICASAHAPTAEPGVPLLPREFETERAWMRPFRFTDLDDVFAYASDPAFGQYVPLPRPYLREHAEEFLIRETLLGAMHQIQMPMNQVRAAEQIFRHKGDAQHDGLLRILQQIQASGEEAVAMMKKCIPQIYQAAVVPVNLNKILHEVMLLSEPRFQSHDIEVHWHPMQALPAILGSENRLRILFKQLIDNAIEAMMQSDCECQRLRITTDSDADLVYISIEDSGPGIPPGKRAKVFEPFYTTRPMGGNQAGMGLVMVKEIINQHQGLIEIDPNYHQGCRFIISFPMRSVSA